MTAPRDGAGGIDHRRRNLLRAIPLAGLAVLGSGTAAARPTFPSTVPLPDGFQPEGIATGRGHAFFVGSLASGAVYRGDLRTGDGDVLVPAVEDRVAVGLSYDDRSDTLFAAGGPTGKAFAYDGTTGETLADYTLTDPGTFVNDVVVTATAAYLTDSFRPVLYRVPLGPAGRLSEQSDVEEVALGGDFVFVPGVFNANGIDAPPTGAYLLVVNTTTGLLYGVDPATGDAVEVDLGGDTLTAGDGILLAGRTLYVVRNQENRIAVVRLEPGATGGEVVGEITDPAFDVPTTIAAFGNALYAVNARFGVADPGSSEYDVVRVPKRPHPT
ncbi:MAG: hypothetical protein ABEJ70_02660 [Halobacteriaceae archaeon]